MGLAFAIPGVASAEPNAALVFRSEAPALAQQVEEALLGSFLLAPAATSAQLTRNWERPSVFQLKERAPPPLKRVLEIADASGVDVIIAAEVERKGRGRRRRAVRLHLVAIRSADGAILLTDRAAIRSGGRRGPASVDAQRLARFMKRAAAAAATEMEPPAPSVDEGAATTAAAQPVNVDGEASSEAAATREPKPGSPVPSTVETVSPIRRQPWTRAGRLLEVESYGLLHGRTFRYYDTLTRNLREFDSGISFGAGVRVELYPLLLERLSGTTRRIGLVGAYAQDFGIQPSVADAPGVTLEHRWSDWYAGASVAWDFRDILIRSRVTFGENASRFSAPEDFAARRELPGARYQTLSAGIGARYETKVLSLLLDCQYSFIRNAGKVGDSLFPNSAVGGLRLRGGLSVPLYSELEIFFAGVYDHFFYDMRSQRGDEFLAGGALDLQFTGELGVSYAY